MALKPKSHYSRQKKHFRYIDMTKNETLFQARNKSTKHIQQQK